MESGAILARGDDDLAGPWAWLDAVLDGVFDQWLQDKGGHFAFKSRSIDVFFDLQAFTETDLLDLEVAIEQLQFLAERDFLLVRGVQGGAKEFAQVGDHFVGGFWVDRK